MLKVAFITPSLHVGGAERWLISLARNLINCETVGIALTNDFYDPATLRAASCFAPVHRPRRETDEPKDIVEAACQHADVVISWGEHRLLELRSGLDCPVVDVSHSDGAWAASRELLHASCKGADYHAAVSVTAVSAFPEDVRPHVIAIPNGVEVDRVVPRRGRDVQRRQWGVDEDRKVALFLGRFHAVKGPTLLIDAMNHLPNAWCAAFIGHGPDEMEVKLHAATEAPGRCMFASPVSHPGDVFAAADVVALPSESEGMPMTMIEAWLARKPVATTPYAFVSEIHSRHGTLCTVARNHSPEEFAETLVLASNQNEWAIDEAERVAREHYTAAAMAQRWEEYLYSIVARHAALKSQAFHTAGQRITGAIA